MSSGGVLLGRIESSARLTAALASASTSADPYRWRVLAAAGVDTSGSDSEVAWRSFAELIADEALMDSWIGGYGERDARCDVGGAVTALRVCAPIIDLAVGLLVVDRCALRLTSDGILLGLDDSHRVTHVGLRDAALVIAEPLTWNAAPAGGKGELSARGSALGSYLARELTCLLQPAFQAIRTHSRYGLRGMWGQAVDEIAAAAMRRARLLGLDEVKAWRAATELIDALAGVQPLVRRRPSAYAASWADGKATLAVKGTCCLYFKVSAHPDAQRYCMTCPLLPDEERAPRAASLLQRESDRLCRRSQAARA